jgi:hypothetical protein
MKLNKDDLKEIILQELSLMKMGDEQYHDMEDAGGCGPMTGPELGIAVDEEPCGCPDMAHNHNNHEGSMARSQLLHMRNYAEELMHMIQDHSDLPEWVELKITLANDYIAKVKHYLEGELARQEGEL